MVTLLERLYNEYNVEDDPTGSIGHKIADLVYLSRKASDYENNKIRDFELNKLNLPARSENVQKRYETFYNLWSNSRINENNFASYTKEKRKALLIFPKFQKAGIQNIEKLDDLQVGRLYKNMLDYSKERVSK